jgi:hypothetical protein
MSETGASPEPLPPQPPLQFETVEGAGPAACAACGAPLVIEYHTINGHPVCAGCRTREQAAHTQDQQWTRFFTALAYGFGAALTGGLLYWGFVRLTGIELGLLAIAVGWFVGKAVMKGSNLRGGRRYQILAVALTYFSITFSYGALIAERVLESPPAATAAESTASSRPIRLVMLVLLLMFASPFLGGFSNIIGIVIIAIGLFEAWKQTRLNPFAASGPHPLGAGPNAA